LSNLVSVGGGLVIRSNNALTSLTGLNLLTAIGRDLAIETNNALINLGELNSISSIGWGLYISGNPMLTSLDGLDNLITIGNNLWIGSNIGLTSLSGLDNVTSIGGFLRIENCSALTSLKELKKIGPNSISELLIRGNESLADCAAESICGYLISPAGMIEIHDNSSGCNTRPEVEAACAIISVNDIGKDPAFYIYPNPSSAQITIETSHFLLPGYLSIINLNGQELIHRQITAPQTLIDIPGLSNGIYFVIITNDRTVEVQKFIKQ
jgi:hypothetical protein